jgi:hypothetical protein
MRTRLTFVTAGVVALGLATIGFVSLQSDQHARPVPVRVVAAPPDPEAIKADILNAVEGALDANRSVDERAAVVEDGDALRPTLNGLKTAAQSYPGTNHVITVDAVAGDTATFSMTLDVPTVGHVVINNGVARDINGRWVVSAQSICALVGGVPLANPQDALAPCANVGGGSVLVYDGLVPATDVVGAPNGKRATLTPASTLEGQEQPQISAPDHNGATWSLAAAGTSGTLIRRNAAGVVTARISESSPNPSFIIVGNDVWHIGSGPNGDESLQHVDETTARVIGTVTVPSALGTSFGMGSNLFRADSLWLTGDASVSRLDSTTGGVACTAAIPAGWQLTARSTLVVGDRLVLLSASGVVTVVATDCSIRTTTDAVLANAQGLLEGPDHALWTVSDTLTAKIVRVDATSGEILTTTDLPGGLRSGDIGLFGTDRIVVAGSADLPSGLTGSGGDRALTINLDPRSVAYILDARGNVLNTFASVGYWLSAFAGQVGLHAGTSNQMYAVDLP